MKRILLLQLLVVMVMTAGAESVTMDQVLGKKGASIAFSLSKQDNVPLVRGYNYSEGKGYVIVNTSGYGPEVLGMSDSGKLPSRVEDMPQGMQDLMEDYARQLGNMTQAAAVPSKVQAHADVEPLIKTTWAQGEPYNQMCPNGSVTGCVAIVMGQLMKYHKYPQTGEGSKGDVDFSSHTWDWQLMLDDYSSSYTTAQADEVARLLYWSGVSADMTYGSQESSATIPAMMKALYSNWKYDDSMGELTRKYYTDEDWDEMLYEELSNERPVAYSARTTSDYGHAFIIDGYKEGLYHCNWGWGGYCNGYFMINNLDATTDQNYSEEHAMVTNIKPADGTAAVGLIEPYETWEVTPACPAEGETVNVTIGLQNKGVTNYTGKIGISITDNANGQEVSTAERTVTDLELYSGLQLTFDMEGSTFTKDHVYTVNAWYQKDGEAEKQTIKTPANGNSLVFRVGGDATDKELYTRKMVVEEGTGTWCGWCPMGIVAMENMRNKYPDRFIGIAIHSGDDMYSGDYDLGFTSYPSAKLNRSMDIGVSYDCWDNYMQDMDSLTNVSVKAKSATFSSDYNQITVSSVSRFGRDLSNTDYRLIYVLTEDNVGPYAQSNNYAGGDNGPMGGFETLPRTTSITFNDVERKVYPSITGQEGVIPATVEACKDYSHECTFDLPSIITDPSNLYLIAMLYDANTGEIVNADRIECPVGKTYIEKTVDTGNNAGTLDALLGEDKYDVRTLHVKGKINSDDLLTLRLMTGMGEKNWASTVSEHHVLTELDLKDAQIVVGGKYYAKNTNSDGSYYEYKVTADNEMPYGVFMSCPSLKKITLPSTLKKISMYAFYTTGVLEEVELNEGLEEIGTGAFGSNYLSSPLKHVHVPSTVKSLKGDSFGHCFFLEDFSIAEDNPYYTFDGKNIYSKSNGDLVASHRAYQGEVTLPDDCHAIGDYAYERNWNLLGLVAPYVKTVGYCALDNATYCKYYAFGPSLKTMDTYSLESVYDTNLYLASPQMVKYNAESKEIKGDYKPTRITLYVPQTLIEKYKADRYWKNTKDILPIEGTDYEYLTSLPVVDKIEDTAIEDKGNAEAEGARYNLAGQRVNSNTKGLVISNGRKVVLGNSGCF